jgi:hypothetical protein
VSERGDRVPLARLLSPSTLLLVVAALALAYDTPLPALEKLLLAVLGVVGVAAGTGLRLARDPDLRDIALLPVAIAYGLLGAATPVAVIPDLLAGVAGVLVVVWLVDDPRGPPKSVSRGHLVWGVPAVAVGLAWASASVLPSSSAPVGIAGALLVAALVMLAYLIRRPDLFDRETAATV